MAEIYKVQIEDENGNVHYPHTAANVVFMADGTNAEQAIGNKVDKVSGKGLSTNDYTTAEKDKLKGIAAGAEVNVQPDWSVTNTASDAFIKNKPASMPASDVPAWAKAAAKPSYGWSEITGKPSTYAPATHTHAATQVIQDTNHRFTTDTEKAKWNEIDEVKQSLEKYASITVTGELLNLPGGGDIAVTGEILSIPLRI